MSIKFGGVPEHYNAPFHKLLRDDCTENVVIWKSYPSGTGAMLEAIDKDEIDVAVVLTEGAVKHSVLTERCKILGTFVNSPLFWGVHVRPDSGIDDMSILNSRLSNLIIGISRYGSGSHLMALVHASRLGLFAPSFQIVDTMAGAAEAMDKNEIDVFLWDITTADYYTRKNVWKTIGKVSGDWPAFVFIVNSNANDQLIKIANACISQLEKSCIALKSGGISSVEYLCTQHGISVNQAEEFLGMISWNSKNELNRDAIGRVIEALVMANIIDSKQVDLDRLVVSCVKIF